MKNKLFIRKNSKKELLLCPGYKCFTYSFSLMSAIVVTKTHTYRFRDSRSPRVTFS